MRWAYGVTTVPARLDNLLPRTLNSLHAAGFENPRLFVDDCKNPALYQVFELPVTSHWPVIRTAGTWTLALMELYIREPHADRYAIFQDDVVICRNLRLYLEQTPYPQDGYLNLYTYPKNEMIRPPNGRGWYRSNQRGLGALALVFDQTTTTLLLHAEHMIQRVQNDRRGWRSIDGGVVTAMKKAGRYEYVHYPSLVQHTGNLSTMRNKPQQHAPSFPGETFDALELLK